MTGGGIVMKRQRTVSAPHGIRIRTVNAMMIFAACMLMLVFLRTSSDTEKAYLALEHATDRYVQSELAANSLKHASDNLTTQVRMFTVTADPKYMERYFEEAFVLQRREQAVDTLERYLDGTPAYHYLEEALVCSNELMRIEYHAMHLMTEAYGFTPQGEAARLTEIPLSENELTLSREEKIELARTLTHDETYQLYDERIDRNVAECISSLAAERVQTRQNNDSTLYRLLLQQRILAALLLVVTVLSVVTIVRMVLIPLNMNVRRIREFQPLPMSGAYELQYLAQAYNAMYSENQKNSAHLRHEAEHDPLTGLYNRGAFDKLREEYRLMPIALMVIDVDNFKTVNDTYGHDTGDKVLKKVAGLLDHNFRFTDYPCRIGGDEFAVIMTDASSNMKELVREKLLRIGSGLRDTSDGLPAVTLSIGAAFSDREDGTDDIFKDADRAMYAVKTHGRDGCEFYGERYIKL